MKGGTGSRNTKSSTGGTSITNLIQKLRRLDTRSKTGSGNGSHVSTLPGIPPPSSIEVSNDKRSAEHPAECMVLYEPHEPGRMEAKMVRSNAYEISTPKSAGRPAQSVNSKQTNSQKEAEQTVVRSTPSQVTACKPPQTTLAWQSNYAQSQRASKPVVSGTRTNYTKSAFSTTKSLGNAMLDRRKASSEQAVILEDSGVELDGSQGGGSYSSEVVKNSSVNIYDSKRLPTSSVSAEELSDRLSPSVTLAADRSTTRSLSSRQSKPASPQPGYELYEPTSQNIYLDKGSGDPTSMNAMNSNQRLDRIKREWNANREENGPHIQTKSPNLHDAQIIVHSRSEVLHTPIKDINICPVHGKYSYNQKGSPDTQEPEHTYVNSIMRGSNVPVTRSDAKLGSRSVTAKSRATLGRPQGRNLHKLSDFESDMESISGVSATSQEVAHITSVLRRKRVTHTQASKMRTGRTVSKSGYIDMRGGRKSRNKDKPNGMSKSLVSFAEQSILSFLNNVDGEEPSEDDQQAYEHSTREFEHTTPSPPESHDEEAGSPSTRGQHDRTPTNAIDDTEEFEIYSHPTLHDVASSYDLLAFTLGKSGYKRSTFGILVSKCPFLDTTPSPSSSENSPQAPRSQQTSSTYSRRSRPSDSGLALVVVDSLEEQGIAAYDGRIIPGDYVIEVNGHVTLEQTEVEVARLIESEVVLNLVVARARGKMSPGRRS